uniref:receptor-like protein EIX1 n=1 Tax=Erigeron canadensis TaxID=72917 RepID=UPI001CB96421|nr:receptor-like protein EIX1 [Erigeron canadensis]
MGSRRFISWQCSKGFALHVLDEYSIAKAPSPHLHVAGFEPETPSESISTTTANFLGNQLVKVNNIKCADNERRDLLNIKSLLRDPFDEFSTWNVKEEEDCCKWDGIKCNDQTGHVTELNLAPWGLEGEISPSLFNLTHLTHLYLSFNSFNGTVPESIGYLTELRVLDLSYNSFSGTIPDETIPSEFGNLTNLQSLRLDDLGKCRVENINWLSRLSNLETLNMKGVSLAKADHWVDAIAGLQNLTSLYLEGCNLSQVMHPYSYSSHVNSSSNIRILDLQNNNLNSSMYPWLYPLTSNNRLEYLLLDGNKLDEFPKYLGNLCNLTHLYFNHNSALVRFSDFLKALSAGCTSDTLTNLEASSSHFTGSISDDIQHFSSLERLYLGQNLLNGTISEMLWVLPNLKILNVSSNSLKGTIFGKTGRSMLWYMDFSNNLLQGVLSKSRMSNLSNVAHLDLSSCRLGPRFPKWIQTFKNQTSLIHLNIANTEISDTIPTDFWDTLPSQLTYLNLSSNNIIGKAPDLFSSSHSVSSIDLSSNNFYGPIANVPSTITILDLSKNKFDGGISFLCQLADEHLYYLDLSHNKFTGQIPNCLWNLTKLVVLNLGNNHLFGRLPTSIGSMNELEVLYLYNNGFSGDLPMSLKNCTKLTFLNLGANKFSGNIPVWIGENLLGLYVLSLTSNNFIGPIPLQFCHLVNLQILDLSTNNLNGIIPSCVNNFTAMVQKGFLSTHNIHQYINPMFKSLSIISNSYKVDYADRAMIQWQGNIREFSSNIRLLRSIDLSSNNLTGKIPNELTDLTALLALNLSNNAFLGQIPQKIDHLKELQILDLSSNNISGALPSTMSQINFLNYLDVSYNNLSGRIPRSTQLQSFEPSRYIGNAGLCGPPLTKNCAGDEELQVPATVGEGKGEDEGIDEVEGWFYIGGATGFAVGFGTVCTALLLNRHGRLTFSHFIDTLGAWVNVKVDVVFVAISKGRK